ncbi:MAG: hydrolase [Dongiaceae bacterium]
MVIDRNQSFLLMVDVQERLLPAMADAGSVQANGAILLKAATRLDVPILASEQYPKGLGSTVPALRGLVPPGAILSKTAFSCVGDPALRARIAGFGRPQVVICGIETHVCVLQTALDLAAEGYRCFVVRDACSSRRQASIDAAVSRLQLAGIAIVTTEMVLFEWLHDAAAPEFREVSALIR